MMYYVYLLRDKQGGIYIGYTENLERRLAEHRGERVYWTRRLDEFVLLYYEAYSCKVQARDREKKLKIYGSAYVALLKRLGLK